MTPPDTPIWSRRKDGIAFADVPTRPGGRMPDFCIIGAAKAGTTALNAILDQHPDIFMCPLKESHYFSTGAMLARGDDWYRGLYAEARDDQMAGEASTSYTRLPMTTGTAERLAAANPGMKLVYVLREPVARTESECLQTVKYARNLLGRDLSDKPLDEVLDILSDPTSDLYTAPIETSDYARQIAAYDAVFPREAMLILFQDELRDRPAETVARVFDHLGLPRAEIDPGLKSNVTADFTTGLRDERLAARFRGLPGYGLLRGLMPKTLKDRIKAAVPRPEPRLSDARRNALSRHFADRNADLAERLGGELPPEWSLP